MDKTREKVTNVGSCMTCNDSRVRIVNVFRGNGVEVRLCDNCLLGKKVKPERVKGDTVMIYKDPFTCEEEEGEAELIRKFINAQDVDGYEYWEVRFEDHTQVNRWVKP